MRRHYEVEGQGVPFYLIPVAPNLGKIDGDAPELIRTIREYVTAAGCPPIRAIVIDTLARSMKGAEESSAKELGVFIDACGEISRAFNGITIAVHHSGKDVSKGARGSNSSIGAVDVLWRVEPKDKGGDKVTTSVAEVEEMKDGPSGANWTFHLREMVLREGIGGMSALTTGYIEVEGEPSYSKSKANPGRASKHALALDALDEALATFGQPLPGSFKMSGDIRGVDVDKWKDELFTRGILNREAKNPRTDFQRLKLAMIGEHKIAERNKLVWRVP
jgi:hypothetical protein